MKFGKDSSLKADETTEPTVKLNEQQLYNLVELVRFLAKNPNATVPQVSENGARLIKQLTTYELLKKFGLI